MPKAQSPEPKRGDVYLVNFDPSVGSEIQKTRPALIIQNDVANRYSSITIVAAITSQFRLPLRPIQIPIAAREGGLNKESVALLNQIRSVGRQRLIHRLGTVSIATMQQVDQAIRISLSV